jgi:hypothetical protein
MEVIQSGLQSLVSQLEGQINKLQDDRKNVSQEIEKLKKDHEKLSVSPHKLDKDRILLDVGGCHFSTTIETLTTIPDSVLGRMFSGRFPIQFSKDGRVFIDRDGTHFRHILNFLRDPESWRFTHKDKQVVDELRAESKFYGLEDPMFKKNNRVPHAQKWLDGKVKIHSFSSQYTSTPATNVIDTTKTYWLSDKGQIEDQWIVFEFEKDVFVSKIGIKVDNFECTVKDWTVQISENDDKENWKNVIDFQAKCGKNCITEQVFDGFQVRTKFIRLFFKNNWGPGGGNYILVTNVRFFGAELDSF